MAAFFCRLSSDGFVNVVRLLASSKIPSFFTFFMNRRTILSASPWHSSWFTVIHPFIFLCFLLLFLLVFLIFYFLLPSAIVAQLPIPGIEERSTPASPGAIPDNAPLLSELGIGLVPSNSEGFENLFFTSL